MSSLAFSSFDFLSQLRVAVTDVIEQASAL